MRKEDVIRLLRENMEKIKEFGVKRIGIFGSVSRDDLRKSTAKLNGVRLQGQGISSYISTLDWIEIFCGKSSLQRVCSKNPW